VTHVCNASHNHIRRFLGRRTRKFASSFLLHAKLSNLPQENLLGGIEEAAPSDASLLLLSSFFGQKLVAQSLELTDSVVKVSCASSGRSFFRIQGSDANPYLVICNFCTCRAFEGHTLASNRAVVCKHSLAVFLAHKWKVRFVLAITSRVSCEFEL
jgi:hypothetical protein